MFRSLLLSIALVLAPVVHAQDTAPDVLVKGITQEVISAIKLDKEIQAGNPRKVAALVELKILPHFNFSRMTQIAMGRNWRAATPAQQQALTGEFKTLLVRTYSTALSNYRDQVIDFKPVRTGGDRDVTVKSEIRQPGTQPITIDYEMEKSTSSWKVYDIKIGGVSLVTTYREAFANEVRERGIDGLIKALSDKNRRSDARFGTGRT